MRLRYGSYWHGTGEVAVSIDRQAVESALGVPYEVVHTWTVRGRLLGDTTAQVVAQLALLERAYAAWFRDAVLVDANGLACHALLNAGSTTGVKVVKPPSYPTGEGAELATYRDYTVVLQAAYPVSGRPVYRSFRESVRLWGGLPNRRMVETLNSAPVEYVSGRRTPYRAAQSGTAVGYFDWPPVPAPLFGAGLLEGPDHPAEFASPEFREGRQTDFAVSWSYQFVSATPLVGRPNRAVSG